MNLEREMIFSKVHFDTIKTRSRSSCRAPIALSVACRTHEQQVADPIPGSTNYFQRIDDNHCNKIHPSLTPDYCRWFGGRAASDFERKLCRVPIEEIPGKHG